MKFNKESFCPEPWSQIEIDSQGDFKICCLSNYSQDFGMALDDNNQVMNILTHSIAEAINSKTHRDHRLQLAQNIKITRCRNCYDSEDATKTIEWGQSASRGRSKRQRVINETASKIPEYITVDTASLHTSDDGAIPNPNVVNLDIRFGNLCNQKCIMCGPQHSSLWYEDWVAITGHTGNFKKGKYKTYPIIQDDYGRYKMQGVTPWWENDIWWTKFQNISPQLRYIYFTGGEPLIVPAMQKCLDWLIETGISKSIILRYDTNLSVINKKLIEKWKHFKEVLLCVSVDETEDRYNFIRFLGNYSKLKENIKMLQNNNIHIHYISACIGIASPYAMIRILELADELSVETNFRFLETPSWFDIRHLPKSAKLEIILNLKKYEDVSGWKKSILSEIKLLEKYLDYEDQSKIQEFVRVMNVLDSRRNTEWKRLLPDVHKLITDHCKDVII